MGNIMEYVHIPSSLNVKNQWNACFEGMAFWMKVSSHSSSNKILSFYVMSLFIYSAIVLCSGHLQLMPNSQEGLVSAANIVSRAPAKLYNK